MTHPLARFASKLLEDRQRGMAPRPATAFVVRRGDAPEFAPGDYMIGLEKWSVKGVVPVDRLAFVGALIETNVLLDDEAAERLLIESLAKQPTLLSLDETSIERGAATLEKVVLPALTSRRQSFEEGEAARHYDLAETQRALIVENRKRRQKQAESRIRELRLAGGDGRMRIARLEDAKLQKFLARMAIKLDDIQRREQSFNLEMPVLIGVALVRVQE
jgi:hypothetical protein